MVLSTLPSRIRNGGPMSLSKIDREFYSTISAIQNAEGKFSDRYYEALDDLKHVWRSYYESD